MMKRIIECGICGDTHTEHNEGDGFHGWGQLSGIKLDDDVNPFLCPKHLSDIANLVNLLKEQQHGLD